MTDRVEIDLDWDVKANAIVGEPKIVNAASEVRELRNVHSSCPPPAPNGPYDHFDVKTITTSGGALELKGIRSFPSIRVVSGCQGVEEPRTVRPWEQDVVERMVVPVAADARRAGTLRPEPHRLRGQGVLHDQGRRVDLDLHADGRQLRRYDGS